MAILLQLKRKDGLLSFGMLILAMNAVGQYPTSCTGVGSRANSNGMANSCPNVMGTAYASNFVGTVYATVPASSKTGNLRLLYSGANASLKPFAITKVWLTTAGTVIQTAAFGPAAVPAISGGNTQVDYCFYGANLATAGTLSFELTNPETNTVWGICSYDASCNSSCTVVANPAALPVLLSYFRATEAGRTVELEWATEQEENNKGFDIERSTGAGFAFIDYVPSAYPQGNSRIRTNYSFMDIPVPDVQDIQYRLRQLDLDGHSVYSSVAEVKLKATPGIRIHSSGNSVIIDFSGTAPSSHFDIGIYDTQGRRIRRYTIHALSGFVIPDLPGGQLYFVAVKDDTGIQQSARAVYINGNHP